MKVIWRKQQGFTLVEALISVAILTVVVSTIGTSIFQVLRAQERMVGEGLAANELRNGLGWIADDVKMALNTDLTDGGPAVSGMTLTWPVFDNPDSIHTSSYALVGNRLVRTYDGNSHTVAHDVVSVSFSLTGRTITAQLEVPGEQGSTQALSLRSNMRLQP